MTAADNQALTRDLVQRLEAVNHTVRTLRDTLSRDQLRWRPPEGGWSIADVLEHLIVSHDSYLPLLRSRVQAAPASATPRRWKKSLIGGWLAASMRSEKKYRSPGVWKVPEEPRKDVADAFIQRQRDLRDIVQDATARDWRSIRVSSPALKLIRMNLGDAFEVLTAHAERHAGQMERLLHRSDFPGRAKSSAR